MYLTYFREFQTAPMNGDSDMDGNVELLIDQIRRAFQDLQFPGADRIISLSATNEPGLYRGFTEPPRYEIDVDFAMAHCTKLAALTPEAFRYYLPRFLIISLEHYEQASEIADSLVYHLALPKREDEMEVRDIFMTAEQEGALPEPLESYFDESGFLDFEAEELAFFERMKGLTKMQELAVYAYLKYLKDEHSDDFDIVTPQLAISRYWAKCAD